MKYGYTRVSTKGQLDGNSIEEQTNAIKNLYADAEIIVESYSGAKERAWVWHDEPYHKHHKKEIPLSHIRAKYGSETIRKQSYQYSLN